jgi:hypothetical protein
LKRLGPANVSLKRATLNFASTRKRFKGHFAFQRSAQTIAAMEVHDLLLGNCFIFLSFLFFLFSVLTSSFICYLISLLINGFKLLPRFDRAVIGF